MEEIKEEKVLEGRKLYRRYQLVRYERKKKRKKRGINELHSDETRVEYPLLSSLLRPSSKGMASTPCFKMNVIRGTRVEHDFSPSFRSPIFRPFFSSPFSSLPFSLPRALHIYICIYINPRPPSQSRLFTLLSISPRFILHPGESFSSRWKKSWLFTFIYVFTQMRRLVSRIVIAQMCFSDIYINLIAVRSEMIQRLDLTNYDSK